jgi:hypothetical protein
MLLLLPPGHHVPATCCGSRLPLLPPFLPRLLLLLGVRLHGVAPCRLRLCVRHDNAACAGLLAGLHGLPGEPRSEQAQRGLVLACRVLRHRTGPSPNPGHLGAAALDVDEAEQSLHLPLTCVSGRESVRTSSIPCSSSRLVNCTSSGCVRGSSCSGGGRALARPSGATLLSCCSSSWAS